MSFRTKTSLLIAASSAFSLLICEVGLRLFTDYGSESSPPVAAKADQPLDTQQASRYVSRFAAASGTNPAWFTEDPPPLPNRTAVTEQRLELYRDFRQRGIFANQADYVWNRYYIESQRCANNPVFRNYPSTVLTFDPPEESIHPRFRFPPNLTSVAGLVTNEFGLRGPPIAAAKPSKTIRIAFVGASTTVGYHHFAFSYPERIGHWLNKFAEANHLDVRFEALNAGREGLNSDDIAAIVRGELLPLDPDLVVYYEGSNQFTANRLASPPAPPRQEVDPRDPIVQHKVPELIRAHLAAGDLLDRALNGFRSVGEPRKPAYRLNWPAGVDERNPDADNPNLPLQLPAIVKDLDNIRSNLSITGAELVLCSFEWLVKDNMPLSPTRQQYIYKQLNSGGLWPLRYADIRRLADFQNRVFRRYAAARRIAYLDVASAIPQDPSLFEDAIHMTETGDRIRAWIVFQQLVPLIRRKIESGQLPRPASSNLPAPPSLAASETSFRCIDVPTGPLERVDGGASIATIEPAYNGGSVRYGSPVSIDTGSRQWSYAASFALSIPAGLSRPCYVFVRARVVKGQVGLAVHDSKIKDLQSEKVIDPSPDPIDIYVPVIFPSSAGALILRNTAPGSSQVLIDDVGLLAFIQPLPEEVVKRVATGLSIATEPVQEAIATRIPLGLDASAGAGLRLHARLRVLQGNIGLGILAPDSQALLVERPVWPSQHVVEVVLALPTPPLTGDLVIRNLAGSLASKAVVERIDIRKAP